MHSSQKVCFHSTVTFMKCKLTFLVVNLQDTPLVIIWFHRIFAFMMCKLIFLMVQFAGHHLNNNDLGKDDLSKGIPSPSVKMNI